MKAEGAVSLLVNIPVKPTVTVPPAGMAASQEALATRTGTPDSVQEPFQSWVIF